MKQKKYLVDICGCEYEEPNEDESTIKSWWEKFYYNYFDITVDFTRVKIPIHYKGFDWPIFIARAITVKQILDVLQKHISIKIEDPELTKEYLHTHPTDYRDYAIRWYVDANNIGPAELKPCDQGTLIEALIIKLAAYENHFDLVFKEKITCSGSWTVNSNIPDVRCIDENNLCLSLWDGKINDLMVIL